MTEGYQVVIEQLETKNDMLRTEVDRLRGEIAKAVKRANGNGMGDSKEFRELKKAISDPIARAPI